MLVLGYVWLPFVALPIFVSLESLDRRLLEAASDLGASRLAGVPEDHAAVEPPGRRGGIHVRLHPDGRRVRDALARRWGQRLHVRQPDRRPVRRGLDWQTGSVLSLFLLFVVAALTLVFSRFLQIGRVTDGLMDVAISKNGARHPAGLLLPRRRVPLRADPVLLHLLVQRLGSATFPLSGFTLEWYRQFLHDSDLHTALRTSAIVASSRASAR